MKSVLFGVVAAVTLLSGQVQADENGVKSLFEQRFQGVKVDGVLKTPYKGIYEVDSNGRVLYTDEQVSFLMQGNLIDTKTKKSLTQERLNKLSELPFDKLPFEHAIKIVKGNGKRQLAIFEDPDCPFCKQLEKDMTKVDNVTVYVFLYPLEQLHPGATEKSRKIWCAPDRAKAWLTAMQDDVVPTGKAECDTPVEKLVEFARVHQITGTPTLVFANGTRVPGAIPAASMEKMLDENVPK